MKGIIIGAGRGIRLMPHTKDAPKCLAEVKGRRILDWGLEALRAAGLRDIVFIGGYRIERVQAEYPGLTYCHNADWSNNNVLVSLMHAEFHMDDGFVCAYSDILYRPEIVVNLMESVNEITLVCDTAWRARYRKRIEHPENDAEKMASMGNRVVAIGRNIPGAIAHGEYTGIARFGRDGSMQLREAFHRAKTRYNGRPFQSAATFQKAYLIDLYQEMLEAKVPMHLMETAGGYLEIDTNQDFEIARKEW